MTRFNARNVLVSAGALALTGSAISSEIAWLHMRWLAATYGVICGSEGVAHCAACPTAAGLLAAGLALLAAAARVRPAGVRSRAR